MSYIDYRSVFVRLKLNYTTYQRSSQQLKKADEEINQIANFLNAVDFPNRFDSQISVILKATYKHHKKIDLQKTSDAFSSIECFANKLCHQPWKQEYTVIKVGASTRDRFAAGRGRTSCVFHYFCWGIDHCKLR